MMTRTIRYAIALNVGDVVTDVLVDTASWLNGGMMRGRITAIYPRSTGKASLHFENGMIWTYPLDTEFAIVH